MTTELGEAIFREKVGRWRWEKLSRQATTGAESDRPRRRRELAVIDGCRDEMMRCVDGEVR